MRLGTAAVLLFFLAAGCSVGSSSGSSGGATLLDQAGSGYTNKLDVALDLDTASKATPAAAAATRTALREQGYSAGEEKVWVKGDEYVTVLQLTLSTTVGAAALVSFEQSQLQGSLGARVYPDPQIPDAQAFDLSGQTRAGSHNAFCQGVWFPSAEQAYEVVDCASTPRFPDFVLGLALKQYELAGGEPPSPTP